MDPFTLPGIHEHMIRSPPPTTWPKSPNCRVFHFPNGDDETLRVEVKEKTKSESKSSKSSVVWESDASPSKSLSRFHMQDKFSLLAPAALRSAGEDSVHLMSDE